MTKCIYKSCDRPAKGGWQACSGICAIKHQAILKGEVSRTNPPLVVNSVTEKVEYQLVYWYPVHYEDLRNISLSDLEPYGVPHQVRADRARFISIN